MSGAGRPLPAPTEATRPFWDACRRHKLVVQRCRSCGAYEYPPLPLCGHCQRDSLDWVESSGQGVIHSATTVYRPQTPALEAPYVVAIVRMEEGWHIASNVVDCEPGDVNVDMPVRVTFREIGDGIHLPLFRPSDGG